MPKNKKGSADMADLEIKKILIEESLRKSQM